MLGQSNSNIGESLEGSNGWEVINRDNDGVEIKYTRMSYYYHSSTNLRPNITDLNYNIRLCRYNQQKNQSVQDCIKEVRSLNEVVKEIDGSQGVR